MNKTTASRNQLILEEVLRVGGVLVEDLARLLGVSAATVRRDLADLERRGLLRRTRGGAVSVELIHSDRFLPDSAFQDAMQLHAAEKRRIALAAAGLVEDGDTIALPSGTTVALLARSLRHRRGISVVTNNVNVALELTQREGISVLVTGGYVRGNWFSVVGPTTLNAIRSIEVDKAFVSMRGIDPAWGLTARYEDDATVNRAMLAQARMKIAIADHSKFGTVATMLICPPAEIDLLITDTGASQAAIAPFQEMGIEVWRV